MTSWARRALLTMTPGALVLLLACDGGFVRHCTAIGAESSVNVVTTQVARALRDDVVAVEVCVDGTCRRAPYRQWSGSVTVTSVRFPDDVMRRPRIAVDILLRRKEGRTSTRATGELAPRRLEVNGEGCGPVVWQAVAVLNESASQFSQPPRGGGVS